MDAPVVFWLVGVLGLGGALCPYSAPVPPASAPAAPATAVLVVNAPSANCTYELPFLPDPAAGRRRLAGAYPYTVDWGDGTAVAACDNEVPCGHVYANPGNYTVTLAGPEIVGFTTRDSLRPSPASCADKTLASGAAWYDNGETTYNCAWYSGGTNCAQYGSSYAQEGLTANMACCACGGGQVIPAARGGILSAIHRWGPVRLHTTAGYHFARAALTSAPPPLPATPGLRSLAHCLDGLGSLGAATLDVSALDTSALTNLSAFAAGAPQLALVGLEHWNTSALVDASRAFVNHTGALAGVELWRVGALEYAAEMFSGARSLDVDLTGWAPRRLRTFDGMFYFAAAFRGRGLGAWWSSNLANGSMPCGRVLSGTQCPSPLCRTPAWCYNASTVFEAQLNVLVAGTAKQLFVVPTNDTNPLRVHYGDGAGWVTCRQADATSWEAASICRPATSSTYSSTGLYTLLIEGRLDGLLTLVSHTQEEGLKVQAIYAWGNVSLASPPAYRTEGTLLTGFRSPSEAFFYANQPPLAELFYLAPTAGTHALARVDRADFLFFNAFELVGDLRDWLVPFNGSAYCDFTNAYKFNQDISAWPMQNITNTVMMFKGAYEFNQPLDAWAISSTSMSQTFMLASKFNQPLPSWNQRGTLTDIDTAFKQAFAFNQPLDTWNMSAVFRFTSAFAFACSFNQNLSVWPAPTTLLDCQRLMYASHLTYATLPAGCRSYPPESYSWRTYTVADCTLQL